MLPDLFIQEVIEYEAYPDHDSITFVEREEKEIPLFHLEKPCDSKTLKVFLNGVLQLSGYDKDYVLYDDNKTIEFMSKVEKHDTFQFHYMPGDWKKQLLETINTSAVKRFQDETESGIY